MLSNKEKIERDILRIVRDAKKPIGCGIISTLLQAEGYSVSEATVGRVLRDLDNMDYTEKAGYQGRTLSCTGEKRLIELCKEERRLQWGVEFAEALQGHTKEQLLEVLVARRAIESELAALAAQNATSEQCSILQQILQCQRTTTDFGGTTAQEDIEFHAAIAQMSGNAVLKAAIALIRQDTQLSPVLEYIRKRVHSVVFIDHQKIYQSINDRNSPAAREAMIQHINNLIHDVESYWENTISDET
ncbi:MAG: FCD domain-containing protein [Veillonellales bacterium]